jgi:hypothetical protein
LWVLGVWYRPAVCAIHVCHCGVCGMLWSVIVWLYEGVLISP